MSANPVSSAREAAFAALMACETRGAWCDQAVRSAAKKWALPPRDAALAARLCYGVVQNRILLDFWIDSFSNLPAHKLDVPVRLSLRMGLYQLHFLLLQKGEVSDTLISLVSVRFGVYIPGHVLSVNDRE